MKKQLKNAIQVLALIISGCASISSPTGGEKDIIAPKLIATNPKNGQTNVNPETISLTFDEDVQLLDINRELIIAPYTESTYKTRVKDGQIDITFTDKWQPNSTYSLNFRNSIADITEKNPARNVVVTFSTGAYLDSGSVSGKINYLFDLKNAINVNVLLYPAADTIQVTKGKPLYVSATDSSGNFTFRNIKEGRYDIYALQESSSNLRYDSEREQIAYLDSAIQVSPHTASVQLYLHTQDATAPFISSRRSFSNVYEVEYNEGLTKATIQNAGNEIKSTLANSGKTLRLFPVSPDEKPWIVEAQDSAGNLKVDTVQVRLAGNKAPRRNKSFEVVGGGSMRATDTLKLQFEVPIKVLQPNGAVTIVEDTITTTTTKTAADIQLNADQTQATILLPLKATRELSVSIDTTKIVPFIGDLLNSANQKVTIVKKEDVATLRIPFQTSQSSYIIQLLQDGKVVKEEKNLKTALWEDLKAGRYQLRILIDTNKNGIWNKGDLQKKQLPEPVYLHPEAIELRTNWEVEIDPPVKF